MPAFVSDLSNRIWAFARADALALAFAVALLVIVSLPMLAHTPARSEQAVCVNHLRLIGRGLQLWGAEHGGRVPWRTLSSEGGTQPLSGNKPAAAWVEFVTISNELASPNLLVCPSDGQTTRVATDFSTSTAGGFLNSAYRNNALSYFVGLDVYPEFSRSIISGDPDFTVDAVGVGCSAGYTSVARLNAKVPFRDIPERTGWTNRLHRSSGNLLFNDGRVQIVSSWDFERVWRTGDDNGSSHILMPK